MNHVTAFSRTNLARSGLAAVVALGALVAGATPSASAIAAPAGAVPASAAAAVGALPIGSANYPVPASGAYFVAPGGSDAANGSKAAPWRTVTKATKAAPSGSTIVIRGGVYHEDIEVYRKKLAFQPYPNEAVWFDGTEAVGGWVADNGDWRLDNWRHRFDNTDPTAGGREGFQMVDPAFPMSRFPDQVYVDGRQQNQVLSRAAVVPGTFFVDVAASRIYLGHSPVGRDVRAATLAEALYLNGAGGSSVRGIGFRRYATPLKRMGAVKGYADNLTFENNVFADTSVTGLSLRGSGITVRRNSMLRNGQLGIQGVYNDNLIVEHNLMSGNNWSRFNEFPVAGGMKITRSRHLIVRFNVVEDNLATGLWFDESCYDLTVVGNVVRGNDRHGINVELSAKALVAGNRLVANEQMGVRIVDSSDADVYNNTFIDNQRQIDILDGSRVYTDPSVAGHDNRHRNDPNMTWIVKDVIVRNNLMLATGRAGGTTTLLGVDDATRKRGGAAMASVDFNAYGRENPRAPGILVSWSAWPTRMISYPTIPAVRSATGQEVHAVDLDGRAADAGVEQLPALASSGQRLPAHVAAALGLTAGQPVRIGVPTG